MKVSNIPTWFPIGYGRMDNNQRLYSGVTSTLREERDHSIPTATQGDQIGSDQVRSDMLQPHQSSERERTPSRSDVRTPDSPGFVIQDDSAVDHHDPG